MGASCYKRDVCLYVRGEIGCMFKFMKFIIFSLMFLFVEKTYAQEMPYWVLNPVYDCYSYCATGSAGKNENRSVQERIAKMNAMAELAKNMSVNVNTEINKSYTVKNGSNVDKDVNIMSRQTASSVVSDAEKISDWYDSKTGSYYILLCIK